MTELVKEVIGRIWSSTTSLTPIITVLADDIGPRPSGSEAARKTGAFIKNQFEQHGLHTSKQHFEHQSWTCESSELRIDGIEYPATALNFSGNGELTGSCYYMARPSKEGLKRAKFDGKILLVESSHGHGMHRTDIVKAAVEGGAIAYVQVSSIPGGVVETGNIGMKGVVKIPALCISYEAGHFLLRNQKTGKGEVTLKIKGKESTAQGENVIGDTNIDSENNIICGAHYDTWELGPGAFDNGTGVATLLGLVKVLSEVKTKNTDPSLKFIAFGAEELGFKGAEAYCREQVDKKGSEVTMMVNFDSTAIPGGVRTVMVSNDLKRYHQVSKLVNIYGFDASMSMRPPYGTDGFPFYLRKVPVINLQQMKESGPMYMHTAFDTPEKITEDCLKNSTAVASAILADLVNEC
ncbi:MAG: M28 family peptidase [Candidatus Odinarchaeota archaeon]